MRTISALDLHPVSTADTDEASSNYTNLNHVRRGSNISSSKREHPSKTAPSTASPGCQIYHRMKMGVWLGVGTFESNQSTWVPEALHSGLQQLGLLVVVWNPVQVVVP